MPSRPPPRPASSHLGERLFAARQRARLSQQDVADAAGVGRPTVSHYESGAILPPLDVVERLAAALEVTPWWLAFGEGRGPVL